MTSEEERERYARQLYPHVRKEAERLAKMVRRGKITRAQLEQLAESGDGEPIMALEILDGRGVELDQRWR